MIINKQRPYSIKSLKIINYAVFLYFEPFPIDSNRFDTTMNPGTQRALVYFRYFYTAMTGQTKVP